MKMEDIEEFSRGKDPRAMSEMGARDQIETIIIEIASGVLHQLDYTPVYAHREPPTSCEDAHGGTHENLYQYHSA